MSEKMSEIGSKSLLKRDIRRSKNFWSKSQKKIRNFIRTFLLLVVHPQGGSMTISKHKNGFYYIYFIDPLTNRRLSKSTGQKLKKDALIFLSEFASHLQKQSSPQNTLTLNEAIYEHLKWSEAVHCKNTTLTYKTTFNAIAKYFGNIRFALIDRNKLEEFFTYRLRTVSVYQARKDYIHLHCLLNRYVEKKILRDNPCAGIKKFRLPEKQPSYFTKTEFSILMNTITEKDIQDIVLFAVNTGLRQMELITLTWSQIFLEQRILILDNRTHLTKSKKVRQVPLNNTCNNILLRRSSQRKDSIRSDDNVFTISNKRFTQDGLSKKFKRHVLNSGVNPKLNFHSLRHTTATWLVQKGVSIYKVSQLLGHSDIRVTQIYANLVIDDLQNTVSLLDEF